MIKQSFPLRVLCITFLVLALPLLVDSFLFFQTSYKEAITEAKASLKDLATFRTFSLVGVRSIEQELLKEVSYILHVKAQDKELTMEEYSKELAELASVTDGLEFFILEPEGSASYKVVASSNSNRIGKVFISYRQLPRVAEGDGRSFLRYSFDDVTGNYEPYIYMGRPFELGQKKELLMLGAEVQKAFDKMLDTEGVGKQFNFALVQEDGIILASNDHTLEGHFFENISQERRSELDRQEKLGLIKIVDPAISTIKGSDPSIFQFIHNGKVQLAYRAYIPSVMNSLIVYSPKGAFFAKEIQKFLIIYLLYGAIFVVGGAVTYWLTLWLSRPLQQLSFVMGEVRRGNLGVRFEPAPFGYEINFLGRVFNTTLDALLVNIQRLEDERVQKETYEREISIGRKVQKNLLPPPVKPSSYVEIKGHYQFAREVGGDFHDYSIQEKEGGEKIVSLVVADASGKGISSCLYALAARSFIRSYATLYSDVGEILVHANNAFLLDTGDTGMFVTVLMGSYSSKTKLLTYYSCGHSPGFVQRKSGEVIVLEHSGMAMGLLKARSFTTHTIDLHSGDRVIFYTDGVTDVTNQRGVVFSQRRLINTLKKNNWESPTTMIEGIMKEVTHFSKKATLEEEMTILVMKVL